MNPRQQEEVNFITQVLLAGVQRGIVIVVSGRLRLILELCLPTEGLYSKWFIIPSFRWVAANQTGVVAGPSALSACQLSLSWL